MLMNRKTIMIKHKEIFAIIAILTVASANGQGIIAYDNTTGYQGIVTSQRNVEIGDEINLITRASIITDFQFEYHYTGFTPANGTLRIYANDGPLLPGSSIAQTGTLLLQSDPFSLQNGFHQGAVSGLSLNVPGRITWTIDFDGILTVDNAGLLFYNGVLQGSGPGQSNDDHWENLGTVGVPNWVLMNNTLNGVVDNFGARVTVVPEPSLLALFALGSF